VPAFLNTTICNTKAEQPRTQAQQQQNRIVLFHSTHSQLKAMYSEIFKQAPTNQPVVQATDRYQPSSGTTITAVGSAAERCVNLQNTHCDDNMCACPASTQATPMRRTASKQPFYQIMP
jgi:hypothetical protein